MKNQASVKEKKESKSLVNHGESRFIFRSLWFFIACCLGLSLVAAAANTAEKELFSSGQVTRLILDNGMTVLLKENHNLPLTSFILSVNAGSAQEGKFAGCGISHFIEHMIFKGTDSRGPGDIFQEVQSYGGDINAFTSYDYTAYTIILPSEFNNQALDILSDMANNSAFPKEEADREQEVILKEIRLNQDQPARYAQRLLWQTAYTEHFYKYPIIGEEELFKKLTRKDLVNYYRKTYTAENITLAIVGDFQTDALVPAIKQLFAAMRTGSQKQDLIIEPKQNGLRQKTEQFTAGLSYLLLGFHTVTINDPDLFALDVLASILGSGQSSRLYQSAVEENKLCYSIDAANYTPRDAGMFVVSAVLDERSREKLSPLILEQIETVKTQEVTGAELKKAQAKISSEILFRNQTIDAQAYDMALNQILTGNVKFTEEYLKGINQVTPDQIKQAANAYLNQDNLSIVALTPKTNGRPENSAAEAKTTAMAIAGLNDAAESGLSVKKYTLDNGLIVLISRDNELPLAAIRVALEGGLRAEEAKLNGISNLTAQMLTKGTKNKTSLEIAEFVEARGASLNCFSGNNSLGLSMDILSQDLDLMLELLSDLLVNSDFPEQELDRQKQKNLAQIRNEKEDIFSFSGRVLKLKLFPNHSYRFTSIGTEQSLNKIKRAHLVKFYRNLFRPDNVVISIFGDIDPQKVLLKIKQQFSGLKQTEPLVFKTVKQQKIKQPETVSKKLDKEQTLVMLGFYGTDIFSADRFRLELLSEILSHPSGRLFVNIRDKQGMAYTLGAYSVAGLDPGYIIVYVATTAGNQEKVKAEVLNQLRALARGEVTEQELLQTKRALVAGNLISRQTNAARAFESGLDELYGLGFDYYKEYNQTINAITAEQIKECANKYFSLQNYVTIIVGPEQD